LAGSDILGEIAS